MRLSKLIESVKRLDYDKMLDDCFRETEHELVDILRSQLLDHKTGTGDLPPYKSKSYAKKKKSEYVDLKLTGSFQDKIKVYQNKYSIRMRSTDKKSQRLIGLYGISIYELNSENYHIYISQLIVPLFKKKMKDELLSKSK